MMILLPKTSSSIVINALVLLLLSLVPAEWIFANGQTAAECETILTNAVTDILACYADNPCTCFNCDTTSGDTGGDIFDPTSAGLPSCGEINDLVCPEINCCSECAPLIRDLYQCSVVNAFSFIPGSSLTNCELDCSGYPFAEVDTTECNPDDFQCVDLFADYLQCYAQCTEADGCTGFFLNNGDTATEEQLQQAIQDAAIQGDDCAVANAYICPADDGPIDDCCPECGVLLANYYQCQVNLDFETTCTIDCADAEITPPSTPTDPTDSPPSDQPDENPTDSPPSDQPAENPTDSGGNSRMTSTRGSLLVGFILTIIALGYSN